MYYMKKLVILSLLATASYASQAQLSLNPEAGLNISTLSTKINDYKMSGKSILGYKFGAVLDIGIVKGFYIQPGLFYTMKGGEYDLLGGQTTKKIKMNYLEVPLNFAYRFDFDGAGAVFAAVGPYLGIGMSGKIKTTTTGITADQDIKFGSGNDESKKLDYGLNFGVGYISPINLYLRVQYGLGLANISNPSGSSQKHGVFSVSLGYAFELNER